MPDRCPAQNPRAAWRVYDGEAVIVSPDDSTFHTLNPAGTLIWEASDGRTPLGTIATALVRSFEVSREEADRDAAAFVEFLCERGLLEVHETPPAPAEGDVRVSAGGAPAAVDAGGQASKTPYEPPRIVSETIFETTALACRKKSGQGLKCGVSPRNS